MKAVQVALILLCINSGLFIADSTDMWMSENIGGEPPQAVENGIVMENSEVNREAFDTGQFGTLQDLILGNKLTMGVIIGAILLAGLTIFQTQVTTPRVVGILAFVIVFSIALSNLTGILQTMQMPGVLVTVITGFQYFWLVIAVIQMATGSSLKVLQ